MKNKLLQITLLVILFTLGFSNLSYGQSAQTSGGVDVDGTWYLGEGLKDGDYFEYSLCEIDLNACSPIELKIWIKGEKQNFSETLWDAKILVIDGEKIIKGSLGLGKTIPVPILFDDDLFDYAIAFKSSLSWLSAFATANEDDRIHGPQEFRSSAWGKIGPVGGGLDSQLITNRVESITTSNWVMDTIVIGWYNEYNDNEMWIVDNFPFPVKALTFAGFNSENAPVMFQFELLDYKENISNDPFMNIDETIKKEELLKCPTKFFDYTSGRISTNTYSMMIQYNYAPENPIEGCNIDWKINFISKYNDVEILDQVQYDIWVVDKNNNKLYSYAQSIGKENLFNEFGQVEHFLPIEQKAGLVRYAIFVQGTGPEQEPDISTSGFAIVEIEIEKNPLLEKINDKDTPVSKIPIWIKNNAGWWADGGIDDEAFVNGIQFLIKEDVLKIPPTSQGPAGDSNEIPAWIKNNAGWWADGGIDDEAFVNGIKYLIEQGIIRVS